VNIQVEVDLAAGVPPYEQIRLQVLAHVASGRLRAGDRLPTIRDLATDLGVAAGTVARAYRELESACVVVTRRRTGTVVGEVLPAPAVEVRLAADTFVATARAAGLGDDAVLDIVRGAMLAPDGSQGRSVRG
jgi:GntR family transcriptional regulator